jgi:hypothetical protein
MFRQRLDTLESAWKDCGMQARLAGAALWVAVSCLPRSDDLGAYSSEWSSSAAESAGASGAAGAAGTSGAGSGQAGSDGVVAGGSGPDGGMDGGALGGAAGSGDTSSEADEPCDDGILSEDATRCYIVSSAGAAWQDARDQCIALRGALVKVETAEEDALLDTLLAVNLWLGASDTAADNVFVWSDGTPIEFGNWGPEQPDSFPGPDCVEKRSTVGRQWFDQPCDNVRAFVCERPIER